MLITVVVGWALYTFCVHTFVGHNRVLKPLLAAPMPPLARTTLEVLWHLVTVMLACVAVAIAVYPVTHGPLDLALVEVFAVVILFLVFGPLHAGAGLHTPQWILLGPLLLCMAGLRLSVPYVAPVLLGLIAIVHLAWALGVAWPAPSRASAGAYLAGVPRGVRGPGRVACLAVALVLAGLALAVAADLPWARWLCVSVFAARFLYGVVESRFRPSIMGTPYAHLSLGFYSPLCALIAALAAVHA